MRASDLRIGCFSLADVRNFGDVLFPMVIQRELGVRLPGSTIEFITATGSTWAGMASTRYDKADLESYDALILGGGEVVHRLDPMLRGIYARFGLGCIERPTDLVFDWTSRSVPFKAWVALGAHKVAEECPDDIAKAIGSLSYVGARGTRSAIRIGGRETARVARTPDLGWLFPRLLAGRPRPPHPTEGVPYIAIQALGFPNMPDVLAQLRAISREMGFRILLVPLTRCWGDVEPLTALHAAANGEFSIIADHMADLDKLAILGGAAFSIGQSMHGLISTWGQGRPAGVCMPVVDDKFDELLLDLGLQQFRVADWSGVTALAKTIVWSPLGLIAEKRLACERAVDCLFDEIAASIRTAVCQG